MYQMEKIPLIGFLLNFLKPNFATYDWFWTNGSHIRFIGTNDDKQHHFTQSKYKDIY